MTGHITAISGPTVSINLRDLKLYDRVSVGRLGLLGEVVRLDRDGAVVQVYEDTRGVGIGEPAFGLGRPLTVELGPGLLGQIFDGLQRPLEHLAAKQGPFICSGENLRALDVQRRWTFTPHLQPGDAIRRHDLVGFVKGEAIQLPVYAPAGGTLKQIHGGELSLDRPVGTLSDGTPINPTQHWPVRLPRPYRQKLAPSFPLVTGQRCIDFFFPLARGGTSIFPGGFGTGKTILEQAVAKFAEVDVVVYVGCGERGNEMAEMLEEFASLRDPWSGRPLMERTVMVANTSNMPVAAREASIYTAVTLAEYFRDMGRHVLLLADSISRWAEALREISSALEEMPGEEGYPTYLSSRLSSFFARAGAVETLSGEQGSLSMILSVSPPGGDFTEPVTQACLRTTGSFLMLDTALAQRRHFPAINWLSSFSLYEEDVTRHFEETVSTQWGELRRQCRSILKQEESLREVAEIVGAEGLQEKDHLLMFLAEKIRQKFLCQNAYTEDAFSPPEQTCEKIRRLLDFFSRANEQLEKGELLDEILKGADL